MKFKKSSLALAVLLCISPVAFEPSYVYAQTVSQAQEDSNRGDVFKAQLASAQEGDTIILTGNTHLKRGQGFFEINKKVTIVGNGHTLHLEGYNLSLGADVTFQNVRLSLKPSESLDSIFSGGFNQQSDKPSIIFTNGNKLVLDNVDTTVEGASPNTRPIIVLGSKDANTPNAGHGELLVTNSGYKTKLHSIWAGGTSEQDEEQKTKITLEEGVSFVDPSVRGGNRAGIITGRFDNTSYTGELDITLASTDPSLKTFDTENNNNISLTLKSNVHGDGALDLGSVPTLKNLTLETRTPVNVESLNVTDTLTLKNGATLQTSPSSNTQSGISVNKINAENGTIKVGDNARLDITGTINEGSNLTVVGQNVNFPGNSSYTRNEQGKVVTNPSSTDPNTNPPSNNGADATDNSTPTGNTNEAGNTNTTEDVAGNNGNSTPDNNNSTTNVDNTTTDTGSDAGTGTPPNTATPDAPSTGSTPTNTTDSSPTPDSTAGTPDTTNSTPDTTDSSGSKPTESTPTNTPTNENSGDVNNSGGTNNTDDANNANGTAGGDSSATNNPPSNNNPTTGNDPANGNNTDTGSASSGTGNTPTETATDTPPTDSGSTGTGTGTTTNNTDTAGATNSTSPSTPTGENNGSVSNTTDTTNGNPTTDNNPASGSNTDTGSATSDSGNASTDATTNTPPTDSGSTGTGTGTTTNNTDTAGATNSTSPSTPTGENNGSVSNTTDTAATDTTTPTSTGTTTTDATTPAVAPVSSASNLPQDVANLLPLARANYTAIVPHFAFDSIRTRLTHSRIGLQEDSLTASVSGMAPTFSAQDNLWVNSKYQRINRYNEHKLRHLGLQIGYDKAFTLEYGLLRLGTAVDLEKGENSFADTTDKLSTRSYGLSLYGSYETETQQYFDLIIRAAKISSKLDHVVTEKYRNSQYSVGIGYGKRIDLSTRWQIEPMLQLNYAHVTSTGYMYNGVKVKLKSIDSLIGSLGIQTGFNLSPNTLIYGKAMVHREFAGQQKLDLVHSAALNAQYAINNKATWGTLGFGVKAKWSKNTSMYFDANKVVGGGYRNSYQVNLGLQWQF